MGEKRKWKDGWYEKQVDGSWRYLGKNFHVDKDEGETDPKELIDDNLINIQSTNNKYIVERKQTPDAGVTYYVEGEEVSRADGEPVDSYTEKEIKEVTDLSLEDIDEQAASYTDISEGDNKENFDQWFGDSQIVDENGDPKVVYHGSESEFEEFAKQDTAEGYFFTDDKEAAEGYGEKIYPVYLKMENPVDLRDPVEFYRNIKKEDWDSLKVWIDEEFEADEEENTEAFMSWLQSGDLYSRGLSSAQNQLMNELRALGYDGVIFSDAKIGGGVATSYVAFEPNQIKSAENSGEFDPDDSNIYKSDHFIPIPNYKKAEGEHNCGNCGAYYQGYCEMYGQMVKANYICDKWYARKEEFDELDKGKKANIGEIRKWSDGYYKKQVSGDWKYIGEQYPNKNKDKKESKSVKTDDDKQDGSKKDTLRNIETITEDVSRIGDLENTNFAGFNVALGGTMYEGGDKYKLEDAKVVDLGSEGGAEKMLNIIKENRNKIKEGLRGEEDLYEYFRENPDEIIDESISKLEDIVEDNLTLSYIDVEESGLDYVAKYSGLDGIKYLENQDVSGNPTTALIYNTDKLKKQVSDYSYGIDDTGIYGQYEFYALDEENNKVGSLTANTVDGKIVIEDVFVNENHQKQGIATQLIDNVIEQYKGATYNYKDILGRDKVGSYKIETGMSVSDSGQKLKNKVDEKISKFNKEQDAFRSPKITGIDKQDLYDQIRAKDKKAAKLFDLVNKNGYVRGWETFLEQFEPSDNVFDLNLISDWAEMDEDNMQEYINEIQESGLDPNIKYE